MNWFERMKIRLFGYKLKSIDLANEAGDYTAEVTGYYRKGKLVITDVKYLKNQRSDQ